TRKVFPRTVAVGVSAQASGTLAAGEVSTLPVTASQPAPGGPAAQPHQLFSAFMAGPGGIPVPSAPVVFPTMAFMCATVAGVAERIPVPLDAMRLQVKVPVPPTTSTPASD